MKMQSWTRRSRSSRCAAARRAGGLRDRQTVDVTGWDESTGPTADVLGNASLVRRDNSISMTFQTTGLPAGEPVTIWWIILDPGNGSSPASSRQVT